MQFHEFSIDGVGKNCDKFCAVRIVVPHAKTFVSYYKKIVSIRNVKQNYLPKHNAV